jgi:hypothetical protein
VGTISTSDGSSIQQWADLVHTCPSIRNKSGSSNILPAIALCPANNSAVQATKMVAGYLSRRKVVIKYTVTLIAAAVVGGIGLGVLINVIINAILFAIITGLI